MEAKRPLRKDGVLSRKVGDEWILYDSQQGSIHVVNSTAEFVWSMCDGSRTPGDIEENMRDMYQVPDGVDLRRDVDDIIRNFSEIGILT